jgi:hypothetical protein
MMYLPTAMDRGQYVPLAPLPAPTVNTSRRTNAGTTSGTVVGTGSATGAQFRRRPGRADPVSERADSGTSGASRSPAHGNRSAAGEFVEMSARSAGDLTPPVPLRRKGFEVRAGMGFGLQLDC